MSRPPIADAAAAAADMRVLVWDVPVRVVHWLLVLSFATAYATSETDRWRLVHVTAGYTMAGLVAFRVVWGLLGTRHARFSAFVRGPRAVAAYLHSLVNGTPEHHVGHNPAGALAIVALLGLTALAAGTGWAVFTERGPGALEEVHEIIGNFMLLVVLAHVAGVVVSSRLHHENLVRAMFTGSKAGGPTDAIHVRWRLLGALVLASAMGFWVWQWQTAPVADRAEMASAPALDPDTDDDD
jgi:cytochrome b